MMTVVFKEDYPGDAPKESSGHVTVCGWNVSAGIRRTFTGSSRPYASMNHPDLRAWSI